MNENLDIIPIHVFADSANKAEMLNGQLRAHGLAVKPLWRDGTDNDEGLDPELVFYFAGTEKPSLDEVIAYAQRHNAPLLVVAHEYDAKAADQALCAGAADWLLADHDTLLAAAAQRARQYRRNVERIRQLEEGKARDHELLEQNFSNSQDAIATLSEGILVEANTACAQRFGYPDTEALLGQPAMDLFAPASRAQFKKGLKQVLKKGATQKMSELRVKHPDGKESEVTIKLEAFQKDGERCTRMRIGGENNNKKFMEKIHALEEQNERLMEQADTLKRNTPHSSLLQPGNFAPLAAQKLGHAQAGALCALVVICPAKTQEIRDKFGTIGTAELGSHLGEAFSACLKEDDLATLGTDLNLIAVVTRDDVARLENWISTTLKSLGTRVFEGGEHSGHLGFVAGYTVVNRIRRLEPLVKQAEEAANGEPGTIARHQDNAGIAEIDDDSWEVLIREALEERRYTVLLEPIEDLASGERTHVAQPCLIDRDGKSIEAASFQPPAERLGLLQVLEHRFVGHALRALLAYRQDLDSAGIIVPLHHDSVTDEKLTQFLDDLIKHASETPPAGSLTLELDVGDITDRVHDAEKFVKRTQALNCAIGLRNYTPTRETDKLVAHLQIERLRLAENLIPKLEEDDVFGDSFKQTIEQFTQQGINIIATGVNDSSAMAHLYNVGITRVQGPTIGEAELFNLSEADPPS